MLTATAPLLTPAVILVSVLSCAVLGDDAPGTDDKPGTTIKGSDGKNQHFCCNKVHNDDKGSGEDCTAISKELINGCANVLYCAGNWTKKDGVVTCL